ncbi:hypothetical protein TR13x_09055 [Caloranaerobacter sp. TR13]|uniref:hypothetical protein n=1 Tax=Caloranaerobacter sp. TR13 TaxID=1302151 RepID=UPI0006D40861|nr:hypothetical protein [Caloranaerobacter sp. TR13]KPU26631.1 hypothetical protein TR13x_09055 [Caloranaerobacter sp. TR13]
MKIFKKVFLGIVLTLFILIAVSLVLVRPDSIKTFNETDPNLFITNLINNSRINIFGENEILIEETDLNSVLVPQITKQINIQELPSFVEFNGFFFDVQPNSIMLKSSLKIGFLPIGVNANVSPIINDDTIGVKLNGIYLGKLPLPLSLIEKISNSEIEDVYYIDNSKEFLNYIKIKELLINENKIFIDFVTNNNAIIDKFIDNEHKETFKNILSLLGKTKEGKKFANDIVKALLIKNFEGEFPQEMKNVIAEDFKSIDKATKSKLIYILLKNNFDNNFNFLFDRKN